MPFHTKIISAMAVCATVFFGSMIMVTQSRAGMEDDAIATRQGYMKLVVWEAGPLFGMAKGKMDYDAGAAQAHADNLKAISQYSYPGLFLPGTSKADRPGKTCALPDIWEDTAKFGQAFSDFQAAVAALADVASDGQPALAAAAGEMGKACGGCHKPFRAKDTSQKFGFCLPDS